MKISGLLRKIGMIGTSVLTLANASVADELYNRLYSGAFNLSAKHKILDEKENPKHDGKIYLHINSNDKNSARDIVLNPQKYDFEYSEESKTDIMHDLSDKMEPDGVFLEIDVKDERATAICTRYDSKIERISFDNYNKFNDLVKKYNAKINLDGSAPFSIFDIYKEEFHGFYRVIDAKGRKPYASGRSSENIYPSEETAQEFLNSLSENLKKEFENLAVRKISSGDRDFMKK